MQLKKWKRTGIIAIILIGTFTAGIHASEAITKIEAYLRDDFTVKVSGEKIELDTAPLVYNGKTYLPISDIAQMLHVDIEWEQSSKTIYLNPRLYEFQPKKDAVDELDEIQIRLLKGMSAKYLGRSYPILINDTYGNVRYYRQKDLQRMGIDTNGLVKVIEKWTKDIYIEESEVKKAWKEQPEFKYNYYDTVVVAETDEKKAGVLRSFRPENPLIRGIPVEENPNSPESNYSYNSSYPQTYGILYAVDPVIGKENIYEALYFSDNKYHLYTLTLTSYEKNISVGGRSQVEIDWYISEYKSRYLGSPLDDYNNQYPY